MLTALLTTILLTAGAAPASMPAAAPAFGLVDLSAASFRAEPAHRAELVTQATFGTPVKVLEDSGEWLLVELPDGYRGWTERHSLAMMEEGMMERWRTAPRLIVTSMTETHAIADTLAGPVADNIVTDFVLGSILEGMKESPGARYVPVILPDGRDGFVEASDVEPFDIWARTVYDPQAILTAAYSLMGAPYLWGGATTKAVDCSGLVKVAFFASGIILPRDASQQARCGIAVDHTAPVLLEPADLLFFTSADEPDNDRITHVGIYDGGSLFVHASGRVRTGSIDPSNYRYTGRPVRRAVRMALPGRDNLPGTVRVENHPWYFDR